MSVETHHQSNSFGISNSVHLQSLNDSILNHLFLPYDLPSSTEADYLIKSNHENEHEMLECMNEYLRSIDVKDTLPIVPILRNCVHKWLKIQNIKNCSVSYLQSIIQKLVPGDFLPLYFHAQNAAILIEIDENPLNQPLISSWQVSLPTETIVSSLEPHISCFPSPIYRMLHRSQLSTKSQCELLVDFMNNTIEYSKSYKSSRKVDEIRDVPLAHYVCQWWITQFQGIQIKNQVNPSFPFTKKHRDQIRWKSALLPFRRSGLWMTIKVVFQSILTKRLGKIGTVIYKLLITDFLTYFIYKRQIWASDSISSDLLTYCLRKIVRRLNKIDGLLLSIDPNDMNRWIKNVTEQIRKKVVRITPTSDWQETIKRNEEKRYKIPMIQLKLDQTEIYQHSCDKLRLYLIYKNSFNLYKQIPNNYNFASFAMTNFHKIDQLPSFLELTKQANYSIGIALTRIEIWVESCLNQWINRPFISDSLSKRFENLSTFFVDYQKEALNHYHSENNPSDPVGYSRFILTSLTIIRVMHQRLCADQRFKRLQLHSIQIPYLMELFEFLVLPTRDDMIRARDLFKFFHDFNRQSYPDVLKDIESTDAFGVYFATHSSTMIETLKEIGTQVKNDMQAKADEVTKAKEKYQELMNEAYSINCECDLFLGIKNCHRCSTIKRADSMKVHIYECPIPSEPESAMAVVFELQMPIEFRCYRDVLWMFINRFNPEPTKQMYEWLNVPPHDNKLKRFYKCSYICHVKLVSSIKSITQTHYSIPKQVGKTALKEFLYENSLQVQITPSKSMTLQDECQTLTPQLNDPNYKHLQFSLDNTQFVQNRVIADQSYCSLRLKPRQFVDFGSFRSGHCLQWWNLLTILELESLPMDEESVAILISHALLQYGPVTTDSNALIQLWCSESHQILLEDHFVDELISRLDRLLTDCASNWQNELVLVIVTIIVMRMFNLCNSTKTDHVAALVIKCRETGEKWIELISKSIQNGSSLGFDEMDLLRSKIVNIGVACLLTFSAPEVRNYYLLSSNQHIISLLKAVTTVHDNIILNKKQSNMSVFMKNLKRSTERILITINPTVSKLLKNTSYQSLNDFSIMYWAGIRRNDILNEKWKKRNEDIYDGWYDVRYQSTAISINCLTGTFLVNGMTIGFLPDKVTKNPLFTRVFGDHVFEVQVGESNNVYITKHAYHGDRKIYYEFSFDDLNQCLIVQERCIETNMKFELISHVYFQAELPDIFVSNYSHWMNKDNQQVEFRPISFQDPNFLTDKHYILTMNTGFITTNNSGNTQTLIKRASSFFQNLFQRYFIRLDDEPYVYMLRENALQPIKGNTIQTDATIIYIHLSRLGIAFKYDAHKAVISSREYPDMYIDEDQWSGTLIGLNAGLLLSPIMIKNQTYKQCLCRKLIVPYGQIQARRIFDQVHQTVTIERSSTPPEFLHQYFVFILNDRLRILQSTDSPTGSLYLALLHAITSHSLPDQYTGMTGMERAFQLLNSTGCWSGQPFDSLSLNILLQIATLSPEVSYYPEHLTCMEKIEWNSHGLPRSMQHFGYYLIAKKLFEESEQWRFMHPISSSQEKIRTVFESKKYNEKLLAKLYWDYRDSYNPTARLSAEMEAEIQSSSVTKLYQPVWKNESQTTNYGAISLVDHLYSSGNVNLKSNSELKCFPLAQWLTSEYELKNIWIGLFESIEEIKKTTGINLYNEIERFEMLLDFLHYISNPYLIQPFYFQILKSALRTPNALLRSVSYPSFSQYENIEETTVQGQRLRFPKKLTRSNHPVAIQEIQNCFDTNSAYRNQSFPQRGIDKIEINRLLTSWRANAVLRSFLDNIQNHLNTITIVPLKTKINVISPQYTSESFSAHYQIKFYSQNKYVDQTLLASAQRKFLRPHTDYFIKPTASTQITNEQKQFPDQIFPFTDPKLNPLCEIAKHYKEQLTESWRKLQSVEKYRKQYPSIKEITTILMSYI